MQSTGAPLNLLVILPTSPLPIFSGGRQRMYQILRELAPRHHITVLCFWRDQEGRQGLGQLADTLPLAVEAVPFTRLGLNTALPDTLRRRIRGWAQNLPADVPIWNQPAMHDAVKRVLATKPIDLIQVEWPYLATYALAHPALPSVLITHDIFSIGLSRRSQVATSTRIRRRLHQRAQAWQAYERWMYARISAIAAMSETDAEVIRQRAPAADITILPNGVDARGIEPVPLRTDARRLLFVGSPTHPPNLDAACWFLRSVWPALNQRYPDIQLSLVNLDHPQVQACIKPGVQITGRLPDLEDAYREADIVIVPLRAGSGTRLKILEAFAYGLPVVSTAIGYEGLKAEPDRHLLVADSASDFLAAITRLLGDFELRSRLVTQARQLVVERYDWQHIATLHERLYYALVQPGTRPVL